MLPQVTVSDMKAVRRQGEFLTRHIVKLEEIVQDLLQPPVAVDATAAPPRVAAY